MAGLLDPFRKIKKKIVRAATWVSRPRYVYGWFYKHAKVRQNTILFESFHGKTVSDSPLYMLQEFLKRPEAKDYTIYYGTLHKKEHRQLVRSLGLDVRLVTIDSPAYEHALATSKYLVNNSSFPAYFTRKPEQRYIQTWHGTPLKTLGKRMRLGVESMYNVQHNFLQANVITFPNDFTRRVIMRDYNLEDLYTGEVAMVGYPRNTIFFDTARAAAVRARYGLEGLECFAYMPTWRGASNHDVNIAGYRSEVLGYLEHLDACMGPRQRMYVNFHSMVASQMQDVSFEHIQMFPPDADNYEFLNAMDALITDYSSVFFDFSVTRKPVALFAYDEEEYTRERGFYFSMDELPFPKATTVEELAALVQAGAASWPAYAGTAYERDFLPYDAPDNAARALDLLFERPMEVPRESYAKNRGRPWRVVEPGRQRNVDDIRTICENADAAHDITAFLFSKFTQDMSAELVDNHRDCCNYLFITKAVACTHLESLLDARSPKVHERLVAREFQRLLPGLAIDGPVVRDVYSGKVGSTVCCAELGQVPADLASRAGELSLSCDLRGIGARRVLLALRGKIVWARELSAQELARGTVRERFVDAFALPELTEGDNLQVLLEVWDRGAARALPRAVTSGSFARFGDDTTSKACAPLVLDRDGLDRLLRGAPSQFLSRSTRVLGAPALVPHLNPKGELVLTARHEGAAITYLKRGRLRSVRARAGRIVVRARVRANGWALESVELRLRSAGERVVYPLPFAAVRKKGWYEVEAAIDPCDLRLREVFWDLYLVMGRGGVRGDIPVSVSGLDAALLMVRNVQARSDAGKVVFPYVKAGKTHALAFTFRDYYPEYDTVRTRAKEVAAFAVCNLFRPYWKRRRIWLVFEKFCKLAQDNAYYFFDYCMGGSCPADTRHVYYVIDKRAPDYANVQAYDKQVIQYMSFKHMLYAMAASIYVASDSKSHLYTWRSKPSLVNRSIKRHEILFLQHGVTALKQVAPLFGKRGSNPMTYFLTTSENEQRIAVERMGYTPEEAPVLGFSRWDVLHDCSSKAEPVILLMPTWRPWLEDVDVDLFVGSDYFRAYSSLIQSTALADVLERRNARLRFFIHPKLSEQLRNFQVESDRVELVEQGSEQLNLVMMACNMLITDYSSVCWDMLYMDKPVVFYQFDQARYEAVTGSYVDLNRDLPGAVCLDEDALVAAVDACLARGCALAPEEAEAAKGWFFCKDTSNRERTYHFLENKGY